MDIKCHLSAILAVSLLLSGCAGDQTSVNRNARHAAARLEKIHFDPNTRPLTADNIRQTAKFLDQFYELGKKDRAEGLSQAQAQQRVASFSAATSGPFAAASQKTRILSQDYSAERPEKQSQILLESATATYWDGYLGRP
ncbi:entry exclusion protein 2 [Candidatus Pantoea deserta]|uniref:Entry exclusion protein 2 n=1 Tax=Candidatus Pantoea deserta TaxID=1869313 RepID=A0A3N4NNK8_9GAMM|nr:Exc2 family lipoprotein [Pantoea deserta]RPD96128.1 entry exclusion protein 2 [Pantoea deserta]